ncbi:acyltransferase family protein [Arthrobacter halodurans]|uniref:Acyltransferase family protein n=1 Tax=Arthrobacter halodurans TaxID=516699 RepID=A0ABV4UIR4_9MICC
MSTVAEETRPGTARGGVRTGGFQAEIQGLRAVAVLVVVVYHLWPNRLGGGYVGVDVFFVVSGFLITSHLYRDVLRNGRIDLLRFWARRIRRLLPLSFVVLGASLALTLAVVPRTLWADTGRQIIASALYVQNWALAGDSVAYSAEGNRPTVAQHFWSLSVEEQFYVVWPLLLAGLLLLAGRRASGARGTRRVFVVGLVVVGVLSFATSILMTRYSPAEAYFATPTRMWEFVAGALVAVGLADRRLRGLPAQMAGWAGLAAILASAWLYDETTAFPGHAALLPVAGTALLLASNAAGGRAGSHHWLSRRPMIVLGDLSYGIYLWHWPLIVAAPFVLGDGWGWEAKIGVLLLSVALAWVSKIAVEDPFRRGPGIGTNRRAYGFMAAGIVLLIVAVALAPRLYRAADDRPAVGAADACYGPAALANPAECGGATGTGAPDPAPEELVSEAADHPNIECQTPVTEESNRPCELGAAGGGATVGLIGDSYATRWIPTLEGVASERGWRLETSIRARCTPSVAEVAPTQDAKRNEENALCARSVRNTVDAWVADEDLETVFVAASQTNRDFTADPGRGVVDPGVDGFAVWWERLTAAGKRVVVIAETPRMAEEAPTCLSVNADDPAACSVARADAWPRARNLTEAYRAADLEGVSYLDLTDEFCDESRCHAQIGSVIVYSDAGHVSAAYAEALAPAFGRAWDALSPEPRP